MVNTSLGQFNPIAIAFFLLFVAASLGITYWAARRTRNTTLLLGVVAIVLGIIFKGQNVAYYGGAGFCNCGKRQLSSPPSMLWRRFTTNGAVASMIIGTLSSLILICLSPTIQVSILNHASAPFPLKNPGLVSIPLAFIVGIVVSLATSERAAEERFDEVEHRIHTGEAL